jgi:hypothetical protein
MNGAAPQKRSFAEHLMADETPGNESSEAATLHVADNKLRVSLAALIGTSGFRALVSLVPAGAEVSWPSALQLKADGVWEWSRAGPRKAQEDELPSEPMASAEAVK